MSEVVYRIDIHERVERVDIEGKIDVIGPPHKMGMGAPDLRNNALAEALAQEIEQAIHLAVFKHRMKAVNERNPHVENSKSQEAR